MRHIRIPNEFPSARLLAIFGALQARATGPARWLRTAGRQAGGEAHAKLQKEEEQGPHQLVTILYRDSLHRGPKCISNVVVDYTVGYCVLYTVLYRSVRSTSTYESPSIIYLLLLYKYYYCTVYPINSIRG
jgi:hypothetical protein